MSTSFTRDPQPRIQYSGDGGRTNFAFPFPVLNSDDLLVYTNGSTATGFAVSGLGQEAGGEVIFAQAPAAGTTITLLRRTEGIRQTAFVDGGPFRAASVNAEFDRIMMLIQEDRAEHSRSLRARPAEADLDFCLPAASERANKLLGFNNAGQPLAFGLTELPDSGDGSGLLVTPAGATNARALAEHLADLVNVCDFGARGDGVTDDSAAFQAALDEAALGGRPVYVPASANPYLLGAALTLDGVACVGSGAGSTLKVSLASGFGLELRGAGARLANLRVVGPGASDWPQFAAEVDLSVVSLDGIRVSDGAKDAMLEDVSIAGCHTGLGVEGGLREIVGCSFAFNRNGIELRPGTHSPIFATRLHLLGCSRGLRLDGAAGLEQLSVNGGSATTCGMAFELNAPSGGWRSIELGHLSFTGNLESNVQAGPRHSLGVRGCRHDDSGKRARAAIRLLAQGATTQAPNLIAENNRAAPTEVVTVQLTNGTNLNLVEPGDLIVLASDADDLDDLWTCLKATRAGIVHQVTSQSSATASVQLATAANRPLVAASDVIRVVGRSGTATADSVAGGSTNQLVWLRADDHCRVFAVHNPAPLDRIELGGPNATLHHLPGLGGEAAAVGGVALAQGTMNGAFSRLVTLEIAQNSAASFAPDSSIGMVHAFGHSSLGDPIAAVFTYRADALGYTELLTAGANADVAQRTALTGTTGSTNSFTYSAHTDGRIYVENRMSGPPRKVSLYVIGAPL